MIEPIVKLPYTNLGNYPTPLMELPHLSKVLGGTRILIKREDLCGLALGGNKVRKFQFLLADIKQRGFDTVIANADARSNHCVQLAAAANKLGMQATFLLAGEQLEVQGNPLLHNILGSDVRYVADLSLYESDDAVLKRMNKVVDELRDKGRKPFVITRHHMPLLITGWVNAADEIWQQLKTQNIDAQYLIAATSSTGTQAGLIAGTKYLKAPWEIIGISVLFTKEDCAKYIVEMIHEQSDFLNLGVSVDPEEVIIYDEYMGGGHEVVTKEGVEAIRLVARTEGIILDPIHTGKAMAGLIDLIHKGRFTSKDTVVFIHTGGIPNIFALQPEFTRENNTT